MQNRSFARVKAKCIHPSTIIPSREHDYEIVESVKTVGVQQPLVVRCLASKPGEYELIDGSGRLHALNPEDEVYVDIREANDGQVFRISEATQRRTSRNTCGNAAFYAAYLEAVKKEIGEKGALARVAAETKVSKSELSQYLEINRLFLRLGQFDQESEFRKLGTMGINKLYALTKLTDSTRLLDAAIQIEKSADAITLEGVNTIVNSLQDTSDMSEKILQELGWDEPAKCTSDELKKDTALENRFKETAARIAEMKDGVSSVLQNIETKKLPTSELTLNLLGKMLVSLRRLTYYGKRLQEVQTGVCQKTNQKPT